MGHDDDDGLYLGATVVFLYFITRFFCIGLFGHVPTCILVDPFVDAMWIPLDRLQQTLVLICVPVLCFSITSAGLDNEDTYTTSQGDLRGPEHVMY